MKKTWIHKSRKWAQSNSGDYLELKIIVQENNERYYIFYIWNMDNCQTLSNFRPNEILTIYKFDYKYDCCMGDNISSCVEVKKNKTTEIMIMYLLMDDEELIKYWFVFDVNIYRLSIISSLEKLID
jgi:hypothetical protein